MAAVCIAALAMPLQAQEFTNPVLEGVADAGVVKYAGKYYLGGVATYGDFHISSDLVHWNDRVHVFDLDNGWTHGTGARNNQVHADDITFSNGLFHLLFSVNYWGDDRHIVHITHATSPSVTGPFTEVRQDQWFENRIDPQVFRDDDGKLYLYMVKFTDGNTIWGRPMNQDFSFAGDAVQQFSSQPGTWETMDNRVAEGPFAIKYRGRYYMMYNANHTATEYGNYRLGVCEASSPLGFNPGGKYPYPVVSPQTEYVDDNYIDLLTYGGGSYNPVDLSAGTIRFNIDREIKGDLYLKLAQQGGCEVSLNGHTLNAGTKTDYRLVRIDRGIVHKGENEISVVRTNSRARLVALALYDMPEDLSGDMLLTPGQPNIVRGPNGWEWWLVYMANKAWRRDQYIDRIHFTNNRLHVDGITGPKTGGFHPAPALPQHSGTTLDGVETSDTYLLEVTFHRNSPAQSVSVAGQTVNLPDSIDSGAAHVWRVERNHDMLTIWVDDILIADHRAIDAGNPEVKVTGDVEYLSYNDGWDEYSRHFSGWEGLTPNDAGLPLAATDALKGKAASDYELSVMFADATADRGRYGVYAAWQDSRNYVRVSIDAARRMLITENCVKGKTTATEAPIAHTSVRYPDIKYTDSFEKQYRFDSDTFVSDILFPRLDADNDTYASNLSISERTQRIFRNDMAGMFDIAWLDGDTWRKLDYTETACDHPGWQRISFPAVKTRALRMINKNPRDHNRNIYRIKATAAMQSDNQLRVDRRGRQLHIFLNDREMSAVTLKNDVPTRIGLYSDGTADVTAKNILYYHVKR